MYLLGYDIGSSSVKASLVDAASGKCVSSAFYPKTEAPILAVKQGWAEQDPESWWTNLKLATQAVLHESGADGRNIKAIGISYQMHGLVCVDCEQRVLRPAIIWCDSRAVPYGQRAFETLGQERCLAHLLNSPGNFTAAKLAWVKENEPQVYEQIDKIMLPGDYIAMRLTGEVCTTVSGLSEGMFWDFRRGCVADFLMDYYGFAASLKGEAFSDQAFTGFLLRNAHHYVFHDLTLPFILSERYQYNRLPCPIQPSFPGTFYEERMSVMQGFFFYLKSLSGRQTPSHAHPPEPDFPFPLVQPCFHGKIRLQC